MSNFQPVGVDKTTGLFPTRVMNALKALFVTKQDVTTAVTNAQLSSVTPDTAGMRESVQDIVGAMFSTGSGLTFFYNDDAGTARLTLDPASTGTGAGSSTPTTGAGTGTGTTPSTGTGTGTTPSTGTGSGTGTDTSTTTPTTGGSSGTGTDGGVVQTVTKAFTESTAIFANPERGFFQYSETHYRTDGGYSPLSVSALQSARDNNRTVVFRYFVMERYLSGGAIEQSYLDLIAADLQACRDAGMKMMPRFCYSNADRSREPGQIGDAPQDYTKITAHQAQIGAVLNKYKDVIHGVQAGLIGTWGEWYYTDYYGNNGSVTDAQWTGRLAVLNKWLEVLDPSIYVFVRYVGIKTKRFGTTSSEASATRVGFHNDGFLAPYGDYGTFSTFTSMDTASAQAYLAKETVTVPMNGESASYNGDDSSGTAAKAAMAKYHWDLLNPEYNQQVLGQWSTTEMAEITRKLGYRFSLQSSTVPTLSPGGNGIVSVTITNTGYSPIRHDKTLYVTVQNGTTYTRYPVTGGIASLQPGYSATYTANITAPSTAGTYNLHLEIVDPNLPTRGEFAVRLANNETTYTATRNFFTTFSVATGAGSGSSTPSTGTSTTGALATEANANLTTESNDILTV